MEIGGRIDVDRPLLEFHVGDITIPGFDERFRT
jgi:hypothetical protein